MTAQHDSFDRRLAAWLDESSVHVVPDHLDAVLVRTIATRQRPGWSSLERWLPMASPIPGSARNRRLALVIAAAALLVVLAGLALGGGGRGSGNGRILVADGSVLKSQGPDGSGAKVEMPLPDGSSDITLSPDGRWLALRTTVAPTRLQLVDLAAKTISTVDAGSTQDLSDAHWAPTSDRFAFLSYDGTRDHLRIGTVDGKPATEVPLGSTDFTAINHLAWSPDGTWLGFTAQVGSTSGVYLIHPDGTGLRQLVDGGAWTDNAGDVEWSPEAGTSRLLYVATDGIHVRDLTTDKDTFVGDGFWPSWSPTGDRIAYWHDGVVVVKTTEALAGSPTLLRPALEFTGNCGDHPELAGKVWCGRVAWSPDGTRLIGMDLGGDRLLSLRADGSGQPFSIALARKVEFLANYVAWLKP